jgi:hypothetical protein
VIEKDMSRFCQHSAIAPYLYSNDRMVSEYRIGKIVERSHNSLFYTMLCAGRDWKKP